MAREPFVALADIPGPIGADLLRRFYPFDPNTKAVRMIDIARGLAHTGRFGGQTTAFYSVAQHSVLVSHWVPAQHARAGLLHDAAEAFIGDLVRPIKAELPVYREIEQRVERAIFDAYGVAYPLDPSVKEADDRMLVTEADQLGLAWRTWGTFDAVTPYPIRIEPWDPKKALQRFLERWAELL